MAKELPMHHDRGDGVCDYCFEEWPCEKGAIGGYMADRGGGGVQDYISKMREQAGELREAENKRKAQVVWDGLEELEMDPSQYMSDPRNDRFNWRYRSGESIRFNMDEMIELLGWALKGKTFDEDVERELQEIASGPDFGDEDGSGLFD